MGRINILSLSWRDIKSPNRGGAEVQTFGMMKNLDSGKFHIIQFGPYYDGLPQKETIEGITFIRQGNVISTIFAARKFYKNI